MPRVLPRLVLLALAFVFFLAPLALLSGCAPQVQPIDAALAAARLSVAEVDRETATINEQVEVDYTPRARACVQDPACLERAKEATRAVLGDRMALGLAIIAAQNRVADALDAARKCRKEDADCRSLLLGAASAAEAEVGLLLVRLRRTPPLPPAVTPAPAPAATPVPAPAPAPAVAPAEVPVS